MTTKVRSKTAKIIIEGYVHLTQLGFRLPVDELDALTVVPESGPSMVQFVSLLDNGVLKYFTEGPMQDEAKTTEGIFEILKILEKEKDTTNSRYLGSINLRASSSQFRSFSSEEYEGWICVMNHEKSLILTPGKGSQAIPIYKLSEAISHIMNKVVDTGLQLTLDKPHAQDSVKGLQEIFDSKEIYPKFKNFLKYAFAEENILFLETVSEYEAQIKKGSSSKELLSLLKEIVNSFIREGAPKQVNLPSDTRRALTAMVDAEVSNSAELKKALHPAKFEISELISRNFLSRFWRKIEKEKQNEALLKNLSGSYSKIWRLAGINGYQRAFDHLNKDCLNEVQNLKSYIVTILQIAESQIYELQKAENDHIFNTKNISEDTVTYAINSFKTGFDLRRTMIQSYLVNVKTQVLPEIENLTNTMTSSLQEIREKHKPAIEEMTAAKNNLYTIRQESAKEMNALKDPATRATKVRGKKTKKQEKREEEQNKLKDKVAAKLNEAEFNLGMIESKHTEFMLQAMESLESLELYRLDKMRDILIRQTSAEQELLERFRLVLEPGLINAMDADPVNEIINTVSQFETDALEGRPASIKRLRG